MVQKKKSNFRGKLGANAQKTAKTGASYGHLKLPNGVGVFNPDPDGRYKLDFLPYVVTDEKHPDKDTELGTALVGDQWYRRPYRIHRNIGVANDSVVCLSSVGKKCPICEYRAKRAKEGADKEELSSMNSSLRVLYVVIPLDSKKHEAKIHIFDISAWNFQNLLTEELKENSENEVFPDLEEGKTLKVRFEAATVGTSKPFAEASRIDFIDREEVYNESILDEVPNLDEVLLILSYADLDNKFLELEEEDKGGKLKDKEEEEEEKKPTRIKKTLKPEPKEEKKADELTWEDIEEMSERRLIKLIEEKELQTDPDEYGEDLEGLKKCIAEELELELPEEPKKPTRGTPVRTSDKEAVTKNKCPHKYTFGKDFEKQDECPDCTSWDACYDENKKK